MKWREITSTSNPIWKPETGEEIEGMLQEIRRDVGPNHSNIYVLETTNGLMDIWGSAVLDQELPKISVGTNVKIKFVGEKTNSGTGRTFRAFNIWIGEDD